MKRLHTDTSNPQKDNKHPKQILSRNNMSPLGASSVKLYYFGIAGRGEASRLALSLAKVPFENIIVDKKLFQELKAENRLPCKQVPILEVDGKVLSQSYAILRYVGRLGGLYPEDPWQAAKVDEVMGWVTDINDQIGPSFDEQDLTKKADMRVELVKTAFPRWLGYFANFLESNGNTYSASTELTIADLDVLVFLGWLTCGVLDGVPTTVLDDYPTIKQYFQRLHEHPGIKQYYAENKNYLYLRQ